MAVGDDGIRAPRVGGGAVQRGKRYVAEAEVHRELSPVVNQVAHHEAAVDHRLRQREDDRAGVLERPDGAHVSVGRLGQRPTALRHVPVEPLQQVGRRAELGPGDRGVLRQAEIELGLGKDIAAPEREPRDVHGQVAERVRLGMRPPPAFGLGHPLEQIARRLHLHVVFGHQDIGNGHDISGRKDHPVKMHLPPQRGNARVRSD